MEAIILRQKEIITAIEQININFKKDSAVRKSPDYISKRLERLDQLFNDFTFNHDQLQTYPDRSHEYFTKNMYQQLKDFYDMTREMISSHPSTETSSSRQDRGVQPNQNILELIRQQKTNFRALQRMVHNCNIDILSDKWEIEDKLRNLQTRWINIDSLHLQIDNVLEGTDDNYEEQYSYYENMYENIKKSLNNKLLSTAHLQQATPQIDIPIFSGNYTQWPTFLDLFREAIHNNNILSKSQKMQHLKGKLRGEAEKLIQHLNISSQNYDTAWAIINQRYNNQQLFTKQIEVFLNQPCIQKQSSLELKRLHDISTETINAIQNLGVDTTSWGPLLVHLISKKLDIDTLRDYQEARASPRELATFQEIMTFLETKFTALEPISRKSDASYTKKPIISNNQVPIKKDINKTYNYNFSKPTYNRAYHTNVATIKCPICKNNHHALFLCKKFESMSSREKQNALQEFNICNNCLYMHEHNVCNSTKRCKKCSQAHNTLLHDTFSMNSPPAARQQRLPRSNVSHVKSDDGEILLTTVKLQLRARDGTYLVMRGLLDQGSQSTLITENAVQRLGLQRQHFSASVTGIGTLSNKSRGKVELTCKSIYDNYEFTTDALIMPKVISNLPSHTFEKKNYVHLQNIQLADSDYNISNQIDILFDAKVYSDILMDGLLRGRPEQPIAQQTKLGWILSGNVTTTYNCHVVVNDQDDISRFWDMEDIQVNICNELTEDEQFCEDFFTSTTKRLPNGQYEVRLPMKPNYQELLGSSKGKAIAQFKALEQKFYKKTELQEKYGDFMNEYIDLGHMKECDKNDKKISCYLPHHGVHKQDSTTTKLRVVFNASSKTSSGYSLNDLMEVGPKLQRDILELLIKWRSFKYVYSADCEKMYRMILLHIEDQNLQKILWRTKCDDIIQEYQLCTLTYGMKAAPYLAMRTMQQLACDESANFPLAAKILKNNFYVDDLLAGNNTIEEAKQVQKQLISMLQKAGFNLRKWCSNTPELLENLNQEQVDPKIIDFKYANSTKTLGLSWNAENDSFQFQSKIIIDKNSATMTKREMLSHISKIYDPLGWLSPITIKAKLQFQRVWSTGINWDDKISSQLQTELIELLNDLKNIDLLTIPRWLGITQNTIELHGFADSSEKVYACAVYCKTKNDKGVTSSILIAAKTKLAPVNKAVTLPRLELCAAVLLSKLIKKIRDSLTHDNIILYAWTDSMITLGWICGDSSRWKTFVANRVKAITDILPASCWNHVRSEDNAADCATRGLTSQQLQNYSIWWEGPDWLKNENLDIQTSKIDIPKIECKKSKQTNVVQVHTNDMINCLINKHSTMTRVVRVLCWVSRFITNARGRDSAILHNYLTTNEIQRARLLIFKAIQSEYFGDDIARLTNNKNVNSKSNILTLNPFIDKQGLLRVGGRLQNSHLTYGAKHPILIPRDSHLTKLLIEEAHINTLHGGPTLTLTYLREKYWIIGGMGVVKKQIRQCVICRRFSAQKQTQQMSNLPEPRVTPSRPFTHTGVDLTGYVDVKANKGRGIKVTKGYIAVFICFSTKAIHLELVSDLSSQSFLAAFKRFCSRRGAPTHIYSDNGTNFVGAARILKKEFRAALTKINTECLDDINSMGVTWHFNAPQWPSAGGLWEAAVKSVKHHLKRIIGEQKLTYEEFYTLLTQIEACLNSRPLYRLTENLEDGYLTPGHFLIGGPIFSVPLTSTDENISLTSRWQLIENMQKSFWKKWSTAYLQQLHARYKWNHPTKNLEINDIVLVNEEHLPPSKWALAKVHELHPGKDGHVRVVTLRTQNGYMKRPIIKLTSLPKEIDQNLTTKDNDATNMTRTRRVRSRKHNCLVAMLLLLFTFMTPCFSHQQVNVTSITANSTLYFDKIADLRIIQDEWSMILYYNLTTYWQSVDNIGLYILHLKQLCSKNKRFLPLVYQLEHELSEFEHYNDIMITTNKQMTRAKRGLINGIGYASNYLFGILDDNFAQKYEKDIEKVSENENHLLTVLKQQTSILEAENNIIKRNEAIMTKQFITINEQLKNTSIQINVTLSRIINSFDIVTTSLSASNILTSLRRIQETLIDTITDIYHGQVDIHLLSPKQLRNQLNLISSKIHEELTIPVDDVRDLYQLLRVHARITKKYLIMEIKIPLLYRDIFELDKIISLPWINGDKTIYNVPAANYIAFNIKKDMFMPMNDIDIQSCLKIKHEKIICHEDNPIYIMNLDKAICNLQTHNINSDNQHFCRSDIKPCSDTWIKLRRHGAWLYSCCQECTVRILCTADLITKQLKGNGIITIANGCMLKGDKFIIHAQYDYENKMYLQYKIDTSYTLQTRSPLNDILNTSISDAIFSSIERHDNVYDDIAHKIAVLKTQDLNQIKSIDSHNIATYTILAVVIIALMGYWTYKHRLSWNSWCRNCSATDQSHISNEQRATATEIVELRSVGGSTLSVDRATSPTFARNVHFDNLPSA